MRHPRSAAATKSAADAWGAVTELLMSGIGQARFHSACQSIDVTPPALKALLSMVPGVANPMRTIAVNLRCDASWVTSLVDTLEARGLVERRVSPTDRRVKTIALTEAGTVAKAAALATLNVPPPEMDALTREEQTQLRDLLRKLQHAHNI